MARILLGVGVLAITPFYPQAWLFEPFFFLLLGTAMPSPRTALPPLLDDVKLGGEGRIGLLAKNGSLWTGLNPD